MELKSGEIIALAGLVLLLASKMLGQRQRQSRASSGAGLARFLSYGDYVAFAVILVGLVVTYLQK